MGNCKSNLDTNNGLKEQRRLHQQPLSHDKVHQSMLVVQKKNYNDDSSLSLDYSQVSSYTYDTSLHTATGKQQSISDMSVKPHSSLLSKAPSFNSLISNNNDGVDNNKNMRFFYDDTHKIVPTEKSNERKEGSRLYNTMLVSSNVPAINDDNCLPQDSYTSSSYKNERRWPPKPNHRDEVHHFEPVDVDDSICSLNDSIRSMDTAIHPLHLAIIRGESEIAVMQLLESEPDSLYYRNKNGKSAMDIAKESQHNNKESIVKLLFNFDSNYKLYQYQNSAVALSEQMEITQMSLQSLYQNEGSSSEQKTLSPTNHHEGVSGDFYTFSEMKKHDDFKNNHYNNGDNDNDDKIIESEEIKTLRYEKEQMRREILELKSALRTLSSAMTSLQDRQDELIENILALKKREMNVCDI